MVEAPHCTQIYAHQPSLSMCCRHCRRALQRQSVCVRRFGGLSFSPSYARGGAFFTLIRAAALFVTTSTMCNVSSASWNAFCRTVAGRVHRQTRQIRPDHLVDPLLITQFARAASGPSSARTAWTQRRAARSVSLEWFAHRCSRSRFRRPMVKLAPDNPGFGIGSCQIFTRCGDSPYKQIYNCSGARTCCFFATIVA
jgi:hypothetical protein